MSKNLKNERRRHPREKRVLCIYHKLHKRKNKFVKDIWHWHLSSTENMSAGGILFHADLKYSVGDLIELRVVVSGVLDVFDGLARVVRIEKQKTDGTYPTAVSFLNDRSAKKRK